MISFRFLTKIWNDKEFRLYELLKLKKKLETRFLSENLTIKSKELKLKLRFLLISRKISFLFKSDIAHLIKDVEKILLSNFSEFKKKGEVFHINDVESVYKNVAPDFFEMLRNYGTLLEEKQAGLIVQGSYSDATQLSYSDIDLVIIGNLSIELIQIKKLIEKELILLDPLQHHGVFFININSFSNYWQMDLPIETLKRAIVFSKNPLKIDISDTFVEKYSSFYWVFNFVNTYRVLPIDLNTGVFFAKYYLSQLFLVPALLLGAKGVYLYKRDSFSMAQVYYSSEAWKCIEIGSAIRMGWNQSNINTKYISGRNNINGKEVEEFNALTEVVDIDEQRLNEFKSVHDLFIQETNQILIEIK